MAKARAPTSPAGRVLPVMAVVLWLMLRSAEAATYIVGDATGWSNVANAATFYSNWASGQTFQVDDILVFNFISGQHDVAVVSESSFTSCTTSSPISLHTTPPVNYTLNATGAVYFICTHDSHCSQGQKLSVAVGTASGPTTSPSPAGTTTPSPPPPPPPPSNSGTRFMFASCRVMFISMAICLLMMW
ncbi:umecyanin-like [Syzygium oleosum]|uniref:umecyanin-like n=1 Tax=Syzygium oleosum TaxID=219896 RepID=UPI0024BAD9AD|nr:umecyanin-like [Syzygium oleosum]